MLHRRLHHPNPRAKYGKAALSPDEVSAIAKRNPEFAFVKDAKIEVRPLKTKEQSTGFAYPTK